jgi:outer membrane immunogenic protein
MNKLLLATAAVAFATVGAASAADLPVKAPPMMAPAPAASWTGCYISGGIGYGFWKQEENEFGVGFNTATYTIGGSGWLGRAGIGCDYQVAPSFLIGAFGDYDWMSLKGAAPTPGGNFENEKETAAWNAGLRVGYLPYPNLLTFVSGGWTETRFAQRDLFNLFTGQPAGVSLPQHDYTGWFIGGGYEYQLPFAQNLTWKTEYRYSQYRADTLNVFVTATGQPTTNFFNDQKFVQTVTTSLVWRFNFGGPVVARY